MVRSHPTPMRKGEAAACEWRTYRLWEIYKNNTGESKRMALKAKCHGICAWDRVMFPSKRGV